MSEWQRHIQDMINEIDSCIKNKSDESLTLKRLAREFGYSEFYLSRSFKEISGMSFKDVLRYRRLAFSLKELRETQKGILDIALEYGFSSHEAFTRAFKAAYGITPGEYRKNPRPVALHTVLTPFDCYLTESGEKDMASAENVKTYFITIPAHKFLHIKNYESIGYWDFWQKQNAIPGQDYQTICALLKKVKNKLDDMDVMAYLNEPMGRICSWGIPLAECYGARLAADYDGEVPPQMQLTDIAEGEYIVFEHGPFDLQTENQIVESRIEAAMKAFDYAAAGYQLDTTPGRIFYFYHDSERFWRYIRPVKRL